MQYCQVRREAESVRREESILYKRTVNLLRTDIVTESATKHHKTEFYHHKWPTLSNLHPSLMVVVQSESSSQPNITCTSCTKV